MRQPLASAPPPPAASRQLRCAPWLGHQSARGRMLVAAAVRLALGRRPRFGFWLHDLDTLSKLLKLPELHLLIKKINKDN